jgi:uncharacterized alkaline shock family protein YloU
VNRLLRIASKKVCLFVYGWQRRGKMMNLFDRFILTIYSLALTILSVIVLAASLHIVSFETALSTLQAIYELDTVRYAYAVAALIFFLISLKFLFQGFRMKKNRAAHEAIVNQTELGGVSISLTTIEAIALKASRKIRGVKDVKAIIKANEAGTSVLLKLSVDGETPIPGIVDGLQKSVKGQIESVVGMEIREVDVKVVEVAQPSTRLRVE